ncbi:MAG: hypothetical protein JW809_07960 [Pirellulales bacterium]|nr:hypothetical protein [Pirellulales bacterium]
MMVWLTVTSDPAVLPIDAKVVAKLLEDISGPLVAGSGYTVFFQDLSDSTAQRSGQIVGCLHITQDRFVRPTEDSPPYQDVDTEKVLEATIQKLTRLLKDMATGRLEYMRERRQLAERRAVEAGAKVVDTSEQLEGYRRLLAKRGVYSDSLDAAFGPLAREALALQVDLAGLEARSKVLVDNIAQLQKKAEESIDASHPELKSLEAMLKVRERQYTRQIESNRRVPGSVPQADIEIAQAELEAAKAELEARRRSLRQKAAGILPELNQQLVETEVQTAEAHVRLMTIREILDKAHAGPLADMLKQRELRARAVEHETALWTEAEQALAKLQQELDGIQPPRVRVIRLHEKPEGEKASEAAAEEGKK